MPAPRTPPGSACWKTSRVPLPRCHHARDGDREVTASPGQAPTARLCSLSRLYLSLVLGNVNVTLLSKQAKYGPCVTVCALGGDLGAPRHKEAINLPPGTWLPWPTSCRFRPCSVQFFLSQNWPLGSAQLPGPGWDRAFGSATNAVPEFPPVRDFQEGQSRGEPPPLPLGKRQAWSSAPTRREVLSREPRPHPIPSAPQKMLTRPRSALLTSVSAAWFALSEVPGDRDFLSHLREVPSRAALLPGWAGREGRTQTGSSHLAPSLCFPAGLPTKTSTRSSSSTSPSSCSSCPSPVGSSSTPGEPGLGAGRPAAAAARCLSPAAAL